MTVTKEKFYIIKPKASVNLCTNPSFELGTTGWDTSGNNTIARSSTVQRTGVYSCKVTYQDVKNTLVYYSFTAPSATKYSGSIYVYLPSDYDGTQLLVLYVDFVGATQVTGHVDMTIRDKWQRVTAYLTPRNTDLNGKLFMIENGATPTAGKFFYIDGLQIEAGDKPTTYFDGNIIETIKKVNQYYWTGQANASTSVRLATTRSGGELIDITDYCKKIDVIGLGMAPTDVNSIPLVDGTKRYQRTNLTSRYFTLAVVFNGTSIGAVQSNRNALIELVKPDLVPYDQPLVIRYQGETDAGLAASEPIDIKCVYVSGLDTGLQRDFERANIVFEIQDSYLQKDGNRAVSLDYNDTLANANYIVKCDRDGVWHSMPGVTGTVYAIAQHPITKEIWIGGAGLNNGADADADYLARYSNGAWVAVVAGINAPVRDIKFDSNGNAYICGSFTDIGNAFGVGDGIARIDTAYNISSLGTGLEPVVAVGLTPYKIQISNNGYIYVVGTFSGAGGVANTARIAMWNHTTWVSVGGGIATNVVYDLAIDKNGKLIIVGGFTNHGDANGDYITLYDPLTDTFSSLGSGLNNAAQAVGVTDKNNYIIGGAFTTAGGVSANYVTEWNGNKYTSLGSGLNDRPYTILTKQEKIYLSGGFTTAGDISLLDRIVVYLGNGIYQPLDINLPGTATAYSLFFDHLDNLYVGFNTSGSAETAGDDTITNGGTAKTYPIITVTGPGLLRQIVNTTTGKGIYFNNLTLLSGEVITMDLRPGRISMTSTFRGSVLGYVLTGSSYDFPLMPGSNRIATFIDGTTDANTTATMQWVENYHGIDGAQYA